MQFMTANENRIFFFTVDRYYRKRNNLPNAADDGQQKLSP